MTQINLSFFFIIALLFYYTLIWGIPCSMGSIYRNLAQTHKSFLGFYLGSAVLIIIFGWNVLLHAPVHSSPILPYFIIGSILVRFLTSISRGNCNLMYKIAVVCTFVCSQGWLLNQKPMLCLIWTPIVISALLIKLLKNNAMTVLFLERRYFWIEFITFLQVYWASKLLMVK